MSESFFNWSNFIIGIISVSPFFGGTYLYFRHRRRKELKEEKLIDYQIQQFEQQKNDVTKANLICQFIKGNKGSASLYIINNGASTAYNVRIIINDGNHSGFFVCPTYFKNAKTINVLSPYEIPLILMINHPDTISITLTWDDEFEKNRVATISIQLK